MEKIVMFARKNQSDALTLMAIKTVSANIMVADNDLIDMSDAVTALLRDAGGQGSCETCQCWS